MRPAAPLLWLVVALTLLLCVPTGFLPTGSPPSTPAQGRGGLSVLDAAAQLAAARLSLTSSGPSVPALGVPAAPAPPTWRLVTPAASPNPMMVYDAADRYVLLLGGLLANQSNPTWSYSAGRWSELHVAASPPGRTGAGMTYDATDREVVLFGGLDAGGSYTNETWTYSAGNWTHLNSSTAHSPPPRAYPAMAYDSADGYVVLFGGDDLQCSYLSCSGSGGMIDTWNFSRGAWSVLHPSASRHPPGREGAELATDGTLGVLLTGGETDGYCPCFNDTWNFSADNWSNRTASAGSLPSLSQGSATYDTATGKVVLRGGLLASGTPSNGTWMFARSWHLVAAVSGPAPSYPSPPIAYDPAISAILLFGVPLWSFAHGRWSDLGPIPLPPPTSAPLLAWDAKDGYTLLFDGTTGTSWTFGHGRWTEQLSKPSHAPPRRSGGEMAYDAADGYVVLFGGQVFTCSASVCSYWEDNDTWTFTGGVWTNATHRPAPSPRLADNYGSSACFLSPGR
ncbi:MAG: kelch repeat-containing protein [Thermoplasmata archaeon]|nr:kelch repeat-containing protein [Thermoplasmata archaeon]